MWNWFLEMHEIIIWMTVWGFKSMLIRGCSQPIRWAYFKSQSVKSTNLKTRLKHFCCNFSKNSFSNIFKFSSLNLQKNFQNRWIHSRENFGKIWKSRLKISFQRFFDDCLNLKCGWPSVSLLSFETKKDGTKE